MIAAIAEGNGDLADILFLVAFILLVIAFFAKLAGSAIAGKLDLVILALAFIALGWFVL